MAFFSDIFLKNNDYVNKIIYNLIKLSDQQDGIGYCFEISKFYMKAVNNYT